MSCGDTAILPAAVTQPATNVRYTKTDPLRQIEETANGQTTEGRGQLRFFIQAEHTAPKPISALLARER